MFEHSAKAPRNIKVAANILKKVSTEGGSVKTLLYEKKLRHFNTNALYALITKTIQNSALLDKIFELCGLFKTETRLDPWLAKVLATELLFGKKTLPGKSKPELTITSYKEQFEKYLSDQPEEKPQAARRPRYVRINTNLLTTSDAIRAFQDEGYRFIRCTSGPYEDFLKQIQELTEYDFTQDYHVKYMFVFASGTRLHEHDLYLENKIVLQDKATAMAVHLLSPPPGSVVLDMCAAPGMKTTQLAAFMRNQGKIYAVERNEQRYKTLCDFVEKSGSKCVETLHKDALELKRGEYDDVEYILLDPSCSGSGMELSIHNYIEDTRLAKLTSLQEKFLKHAMNAFPKAKRIVYSTCSLYPEENERVITNVVKTSRAKWRVQDVKELLKGQWNNFGSGMYGSMGARCMYARPDSDYTIGFFLAVLDRDQKDFDKSKSVVNSADGNEVIMKHEEDQDNVAEESERIKKKKKKKYTKLQHVLEVDENNEEDEPQVSKKKKKKNKLFESNGDLNHTEEITDTKINAVDSAIKPEEVIPKKKNKKDKRKTPEIDEPEVSTQEVVDLNGALNHTKEINAIDSTIEPEDVIPKKKKKKKDKHKTLETDEPEVSTIQKDVYLNGDLSHTAMNSTIEPEDVIPETDEPEVPTIQEDNTKKSKKKNKRKKENTDVQSIEIEPSQELCTKKKKRKALKTDFDDSITENKKAESEI